MGYYVEKLGGKRLRKCYEIAPPRVVQYLDAEIDHLLSRIEPGDAVLETGCGYGRVVMRLAGKARRVIGIDNAPESLALARELAGSFPNCEFLEMDASALRLPDNMYDVVACIQNGISAFKVDRTRLIKEALRVARPDGRILFSTYAERFWEDRLHWFRLQAEHGLVGPIDEERTGDGVIVCKDGFRSETLSSEDFSALCEPLGIWPDLEEVDGSSLFCEFRKTAPLILDLSGKQTPNLPAEASAGPDPGSVPPKPKGRK